MLTPYQVACLEKAKNIIEVKGGESNPRILLYHKCTTLGATSDETPWCSAFRNFCQIWSNFTINPAQTYRSLIEKLGQSRGVWLAATFMEEQGIKDLDFLSKDTGLQIVEPTYSAMARSWSLWGTKVPGCKGATVVYSRGSDGVSGHVGFQDADNMGLLLIPTLGGNEDDSVKTKSYSRMRAIAVRL